MAQKYYWLKLRRDFFKRHDMQIIEDMQNGKDYILFYLKLLVESIDHEGELRFSETIPYNEQMLSSITRTNVDIVRSAVKIFSELGMMEYMDDGTLYMKQVESMIGDETEWAVKKREYRKTIEGQKRTMSDKSKILELEIEKEIDNKNTPAVVPTTSHTPPKNPKKKYGEFQNVLLTDDEYSKTIEHKDGLEAIEYLSQWKEMKGKSYKSDYLALKNWVYDALKERRKKSGQERPEDDDFMAGVMKIVERDQKELEEAKRLRGIR